jgi:hypothetical protein
VRNKYELDRNNMNKQFYLNIPSDKIKISWNKNLIEMNLFLEFLEVKVEKMKECLGCSTGWTQYKNDEIKLIISGGWINNKEYLDSIQLGKNLDNPYNNYVNPFYMFSFINNNGKKFFIKYFSNDIKKIIENQEEKIKRIELQLKTEKNILDKINEENKNLQSF